jgi:6-phosphogluconolactonase
VANSSNNGTDGNILAFTINTSTGALTAVSGSPFTGVDRPDAVAADSSGRFAYVTNDSSGTISAYDINAVT